MPHRFLWWRNGEGCAQSGDVSMRLRQCPRLPGMRFVEIEFMPRVKAMVLAEEDTEHWRPMNDLERTIAENALDRMEAQAKAVFL